MIIQDGLEEDSVSSLGITIDVRVGVPDSVSVVEIVGVDETVGSGVGSGSLANTVSKADGRLACLISIIENGDDMRMFAQASTRPGFTGYPGAGCLI